MVEELRLALHAPVHMWGPLVPLWNLGAYLTGLFDWKAIAALGTFWAVVVALGRDKRATRQDAVRQQALLSALSVQAGALADMLLDCPTLCQKPEPSNPGATSPQRVADAKQISDSDMIGLTRQMFNAIKMTDIPGHESMLEFVTAQAAVHQLGIKLPSIISGSAELLDEEAEALRDAAKIWKDYGDTLFWEAHPFRARLRKLKAGFAIS